jgi:hypothetical protein
MPHRDNSRGFGFGRGPDREHREERGEAGRGEAGRGDLGRGAPGHGGPEDRSFDDAGFRAEDARLNADLHRYERSRGRPVRVEYGHDQNYRPGYHEGGSRFGFFGLNQEYGVEAGRDHHPADGPPQAQGRAAWRPGDGAPYGDLHMEGRNRGVEQYGAPADYAFHPSVEQAFDPDYLHWREQQLRRHDRDYADWRLHQAEQYDAEYRQFRDERREDFHERFQDWRAKRDAAVEAAKTAEPPTPPGPDDKL